ncbi:zinc-binding dehydrogenase [Leucobacter chromiireducens]|uniref:zinc-binding dehydrogenase n=1 Tax=Leucobacter chromiireducens TaxID=283877 RepID=UPI000F630D46|nr:zinc-binding dehydrogenase [Leucobacter chromiireducens]
MSDKTMRAALVRTPGDADAIELVSVPTPVPSFGEVRVRVEAATVNPVDVQTRGGVYHRLGWVASSEVGLGWDVVGVVDAVGDGVADLSGGERIAALLAGVDRGPGAYAELAIVPASDLAEVPSALSAELAATVPLNALTAQQALELLGAPNGRHLLVTGAGGAVGGYASELASELGFRVTGLARPADEAFVAGTGASFVDTLPDSPHFDAAFDAAVIGSGVLMSIRDGGHYVGVAPAAVPDAPRDITSEAVLVAPNGAQLSALLDAAARGSITPRVHRTLPLERAAAAHRELEAGGVRGRIVLTPSRT